MACGSSLAPGMIRINYSPDPGLNVSKEQAAHHRGEDVSSSRTSYHDKELLLYLVIFRSLITDTLKMLEDSIKENTSEY